MDAGDTAVAVDEADRRGIAGAVWDRPAAAFLLGTACGGVVGAVLGTLLSNQTRALLLGLIQLSGRRLSPAEREQLRFELLLQ